MLDRLKGLRDAALQQVKQVRPANKGTQDNTRYLIGLDVGTEYIKALIGKVVEGGDIEVIGVGRARQGLDRKSVV